MNVNLLIEIAEKAFWRADFERQRHLSNGKPGEFFNNLPEEEKEALRKLKSDDLKNIRWDAVSWMIDSKNDYSALLTEFDLQLRC